MKINRVRIVEGYVDNSYPKSKFKYIGCSQVYLSIMSGEAIHLLAYWKCFCYLNGKSIFDSSRGKKGRKKKKKLFYMHANSKGL